jgi:protein SCO1/2/putative membrane protein
LTERSGRVVTEADLAGRVWVASFIFTHCPLSCPRISTLMRGVQEKLAGTGVRLVSVSVDPDRDTPEALAAYARRFEADPERWWFLTGPKADVYGLIKDRFKLGVESADEPRPPGAEAITHSDRIALVGRGNKVVGYFDSNDPSAVSLLIAEARRRAGPSWLPRLPALNAALNAACALLLVLGWTLIRTGSVRGHATCMASAVVLSALFLTSYLVYHYHVGSMPFRGVGAVRVAYFTILISHTALAALIVPLIGVTLVRALRRDFARHARIAAVTLPVWLYVSVTGVVIYLMLYQLPLAVSA